MQEVNQYMPIQANLLSDDNSSTLHAGIAWIKWGLNIADYIPRGVGNFESIHVYAARIRTCGAIGYIAFALLRYVYSSVVQGDNGAKKILDRELAVGFKHLLRGAISITLNTHEIFAQRRKIKDSWGALPFTVDMNGVKRCFTAVAFACYDSYVCNQDKKERWFDFYA